MTESEIRIAIAEVRGYSKDPNSKMGGWLSPGCGWPCALPELTLDAMHEAEKSLKPGEWESYVRWLGCGVHSVMYANYAMGIHATARQRAEAFLRTIGKWKE